MEDHEKLEFKEEKGEGCPVCNQPLINQEGCKICGNCGWSACEI